MLMGVDVGTTGVKAAVFDEDGRLHSLAMEEYGILFPGDGRAEQDGELVWEKVRLAIRHAAADYGRSVRAIGISVQGDATMLIDRAHRLLTKVQLGMDYRAVEQTKRLEGLFGRAALYRRTGIPPHPLCSLPKLMWFREKEPDCWARAWKAVTYAEFLLLCLGCEEAVIDRTMASRTMACSLQTGEWDAEFLKAAGISMEKLPRIVDSGTVVGKIHPVLAAELGINPDAALVAGGHDQVCAALGAGLLNAGKALDSHGTAEVVSAVLDTPKLEAGLLEDGCPTYRHAVPGKYFTFGLNHCGGVIFKWFRDEIARETSFSEIMARLPAEPSGLLVIPRFGAEGGACRERGVIAGLNLGTTAPQIAKAVLEALAFEMRRFLQRFASAGIRIEELRCVGGGAKSPAGLQLKADVMGRPVQTLENGEAAVSGAAMLAGIGCGSYRNAEEADAAFVRVGKTYEPSETAGAFYTEQYQEYLELRDRLTSSKGKGTAA